jgi:hypothetical protein
MPFCWLLAFLRQQGVTLILSEEQETAGGGKYAFMRMRSGQKRLLLVLVVPALIQKHLRRIDTQGNLAFSTVLEQFDHIAR